ncbi:cyclase family protein [Halobacterium salinarum]|uniref:Cyclase family protein n=4 Tax=Halobacterium salinarum TaxID=2242 RepID=Q9HRE1_HALSA|nr:cyclase family protein [Halobacterium salinarum]AAG19217.1 conserved hypothetical protein [Halobacterium salinarum NRC-1]MBB6090060.1 kynurenine formamidase [Halobacterium salinarum]MDL0120775.1 cyclase family protein [Halobacterium salinarum]UEB92643.1 cyclase family protein [Halobacterium salinarum NRC-34001]CAP13486.1 cyclase family protein [Halobacterium salinarum R1]
MRDLSHALGSGEPYPGDPPAAVTPHATMAADGYRVSAVACSTHSGTHIDAPSHLLADGRSLDAFDVSAFRFDAHVVDCTGYGPEDAIPVDRVPALDDHDMVVFNTGTAADWGRPEYYEHPHLSVAAAERCADAGCAVAVDAPSVDPTRTAPAGESSDAAAYPAHRALLGAGALIVENVTNLDGLPERVPVQAYPLPVAADGAPARVIAAP